MKIFAQSDLETVNITLLMLHCFNFCIPNSFKECLINHFNNEVKIK